LCTYLILAHWILRLTLAALDMAYHRRRPARGLIFRSDRGVQYAARAYRKQDKGRGPLWRPRPDHTARRAGRGLSVGDRFYPFLAVEGGQKQKEQREKCFVQQSAKWTSQVVFRQFGRDRREGLFLQYLYIQTGLLSHAA